MENVRLVALLAALAVAGPAAAQVDPGAAPRAKPLGLVLVAGYDFGLDRIPGTYGIRGNDGLNVGAGVAFLPVDGGRLETQLVLGYKRAVRGGREDITGNPYHAATVELTETLNLGAFRFGLGLVGHLGGRLSVAGYTTTVKPSPGAVARLEYVVPTSGRWRFAVGPELSMLHLRIRNAEENVASVGIGLRLDSDVSAWKLRQSAR